MLNDPRAFPVLIMALYAATIVRYSFARNWGQAIYWTCALGITFSVTFLIKKGG